MIDLGTATRLAAGAIGEPGDRVFYLEVEAAAGTAWFVVEKLQVAALAMQIRELLEDSGIDEIPGDGGIAADPAPLFRIGEIRIAPRDEGWFTMDLLPVDSDDAEGVTFLISAATLGAMVEPGLEAVQSGRPRCPRCGLAVDPDGHPCPVGNGDLRHHRP